MLLGASSTETDRHRSFKPTGRYRTCFKPTDRHRSFKPILRSASGIRGQGVCICKKSQLAHSQEVVGRISRPRVRGGEKTIRDSSGKPHPYSTHRAQTPSLSQPLRSSMPSKSKNESNILWQRHGRENDCYGNISTKIRNRSGPLVTTLANVLWRSPANWHDWKCSPLKCGNLFVWVVHTWIQIQREKEFWLHSTGKGTILISTRWAGPHHTSEREEIQAENNSVQLWVHLGPVLISCGSMSLLVKPNGVPAEMDMDTQQ